MTYILRIYHILHCNICKLNITCHLFTFKLQGKHNRLIFYLADLKKKLLEVVEPAHKRNQTLKCLYFYMESIQSSNSSIMAIY